MQHMWPFRRAKPDRDVDPSLERRVAALERRVDEVDLQWSEWFDKFRRLYARLAKRVHDDEQRENKALEPSNSLPGVPNLHRPMNPLAQQLLRGPHNTGV